jgi:hypothetical protein
MLEMVRSSIALFFRGKLFAEPAQAYTQLAIGILFAALCFLLAVRVAGLPYWLAAAIAGFLGGALQPRLFRDLRYR